MYDTLTIVNNSKLHHLSAIMRSIVVSMMTEEGRNFGACEQCSEPIPKGKWELHHTKYEGATYYDLQIICRSCNRLDKNVGLS